MVGITAYWPDWGSAVDRSLNPRRDHHGYVVTADPPREPDRPHDFLVHDITCPIINAIAVIARKMNVIMDSRLDMRL